MTKIYGAALEAVSRYLAGKDSVRALDRRITQLAYANHPRDSRAAELVGRIAHRLMEYRDGCFDEAELAKLLRADTDRTVQFRFIRLGTGAERVIRPSSTLSGVRTQREAVFV